MLKINNYILNTTVRKILEDLRFTTNGEFIKDLKETSTSIMFTCPVHNEHNEKHPSCGIITDTNSDKEGHWHCFTCGSKGTISRLVALALETTESNANDWLIERYGTEIFEEERIWPEWDIDKSKVEPKYLDESILDPYMMYHPYLEQRHVSFDIAKQFKVGYNSVKNTIVFPVWDENNNLVMVTERAINNKQFYIPSGIEKPVYLLNFAIQKQCKYVIICEGQFDALVAWSYGVPAVALFGAGTTQYQLDILKHSGINSFILMYDNDIAGQNGAGKFIKNMSSNAFITNVLMPDNKDIGDCTEAEFKNILKNNHILV